MAGQENAKDLTREEDLNDILISKDKVCVLFYASWCPFSRRFLPYFEKTAKGKDCYASVVINDDEALAEKYSVEFYPTLVFFEKGKVTKRLDAPAGIGLNEKQLADFVNKCGLG